MVNLFRHAIVSNGLVTNIVCYASIINGTTDGITGEAIASDTAQIGDSYINSIFTSPIVPILPAPLVTEVSAAQAYHALALTPAGNSTLYDVVLAWIITQPIAIQIDFNKRSTFKISHPTIQQAKVAMSWTDKQLQDLFTLASTL